MGEIGAGLVLRLVDTLDIVLLFYLQADGAHLLDPVTIYLGGEAGVGHPGPTTGDASGEGANPVWRKQRLLILNPRPPESNSVHGNNMIKPDIYNACLACSPDSWQPVSIILSPTRFLDFWVKGVMEQNPTLVFSSEEMDTAEKMFNGWALRRGHLETLTKDQCLPSSK